MNIRRFISLCVIILMLLSTVSCAASYPNENTDSVEETLLQTDTAQFSTETQEIDARKEIDIYLIAGQSNANGRSKITDYEAAYEWAPELQTGYSNIHYAGNARSNTSDYTTLINREIDWTTTKLGYGYAEGYFGPEAGMAKALSAYYNEETGKHAGLIKFAHNGTSLLDVKINSNQHGNWVPPSYAKALNVSYNTSDITGALYRGLLDQVEKNIKQLKEYGGFTKVNIKGLYWMQGCNNKSKPAEYRVAFEYFAKDIRNDLAAIMKEFTGTENDCGASQMPIFIGTISETQNLTSANTINVNRTFIQMQKNLVNIVDNCYIVDNSQFAITKWNTTTNKAEILGSDKAHWNQADALTIGENVGKAIIQNCLS